MQRKKIIDVAFYSALVLFTAGNAAFQHWRAQPRIPLISTFDTGRPLPRLEYRMIGRDSLRVAPSPSRGQCQILVVFSPTCPHCHTAAARDASAPDSLTRLPTTWIAVQNNHLLADFEARLRRGAVLTHSPDAKAKLRVQGVPAGFLVGPDNTIRSVWIFNGRENHDELRSKCAALGT